MKTATLTAEAEAGYDVAKLTPRFVVRGTPVSRLAQLILDALDAGDTEMAVTVARRLFELGGKA